MPKRLNDICEGDHLDPEKVKVVQDQLVSGLAATRMAQAFRGLSDPSRIRILSTLLGGEMCVFDLAHLVQMTQSAVSHQLATLRDSGLVKFRKIGRKVYYSLEDDHVLNVYKVALDYISNRSTRAPDKL